MEVGSSRFAKRVVMLAGLGALLVTAPPGAVARGAERAAPESEQSGLRATVVIEPGVRIAGGGSPGLYQFSRRLLRVYYNTPEIPGIAVAKTRNGLKFR